MGIYGGWNFILDPRYRSISFKYSGFHIAHIIVKDE